VLGEPGVGKTRLLDVAAAIGAENGTRVLRASGVEFEADVSYFSLNQLLLPVQGNFEALAAIHRTALGVALGFGEGPPPDRLLVSNATLAVLRQESARGPMLVIIDDLPWIDRASAAVLGFVARRLGGARIAFLAAARTGVESFFERAGLSEHELRPLNGAAASGLIDARFPVLAPAVRQRLLSEAQGNPLALLELPAALSEPERAALRALPTHLPLSRRLLALFATRVAGLPQPTRRLLLLTALDGSGDLRVLDAHGGGEQGLEQFQAAETARLAYLDPRSRRLAFRHPLIRTAVVELSTSHERRQAHGTLSELWSDEPDRRAWHLAEATVEPDPYVAELLDQAAHRVLRRGDAVGAVAAWTRAAELSPGAADSARRLAHAAYVGAEEAGELGKAAVLLADARNADPLVDGSLHAAAAAMYLLINGDGDVDTAHRLLLGAIETGQHNFDASDDALIEAMHNLLLVCWFGGRQEMWDSFYSALARLDPGPPDVLSVVSKTFTDVRSVSAVRAEFDALAATMHDETDPTRIMRFGQASIYVDRLADAREGAWRLVRHGREGGPARRHLGSLQHLCLDDFLTGRWEEGQQLADEGLAVCEAHGYRFFAWYFLYQKAILAAARGEHDASLALADMITRWAEPRGVHSAIVFAEHPRVLCALGRGDYEAAYQHASLISPAGTLVSHVPHALWLTFDMVEAAMRTHRQHKASAHVDAMTEAGVASISPRMAMLAAGCAGMAAADSSAATVHFERALSSPGVDPWPFELARIQLAYGERLRRSRAGRESRPHLTAAVEIFERLGALPWLNRARNELRASGQTKPRAGEYDRDVLTPQEREIALLAAEGLTSKQIAERLFVSPRTVSTHLYRLFPKLGITSRAALRDALASLPEQERSDRG
jgi:DNA-binding CsgD family transcriptional regulator